MKPQPNDRRRRFREEPPAPAKPRKAAGKKPAGGKPRKPRRKD